MIQFSLMAFFLVLFSSELHADDAYIEVIGGTAKLMSAHPAIRMVGEEVRLIINSTETYEVDATFKFFNSEKSTTVLVGFPMDGGGPEGKIIGEFRSFKTTVNGKEVSTINKYRSFREEMPLDEKWKIKDVYFPGGEETVTRVRYTAPYGRYSTGNRFVSYVIGTGGSWAGTIGVSTFTVVFSGEVLYRVMDPFVYASSLTGKTKFVKTQNSISWITPEFEPSANEIFSLVIPRPRK